MSTFADNLQTLPDCNDVIMVELHDANGTNSVIENKPGSAGSVRVYAHLANKWGDIGVDAAREGLALYAEHTEDARIHPGKHPNIDRLFEVLSLNCRYEVVVVKR